MPEPIPMLSAAPAGAGSAASSAADQRAAEATPFDAMLQAGLARRESSEPQKAPVGTPAEPRPAGDKAAGEEPAKAAADEDPLVALIAYAAADITAALLASAAPDPAAAKPAAPADPAGIQAVADQHVQAAAPIGAQLRASGIPNTDTLIDPPSVTMAAATSGLPATAPGEPVQADAIADRPAERATDAAAAAQALAQDARAVASQQPAAAAPAAASTAAKAGAGPAATADTRVRKPGTSETDETSPARRGPQVAADAAPRPTAEGGVKEDRLQERRSDAWDAADRLNQATAQRTEDKFAHVLKVQEPKTAERPLDISPRIDAMARTDAMPQADAAQAPAAAARPSPVLVIHVEQRVGSAHWNQDFVSQVNLLVSHREPQAEIRVNPPQLGPVEVRIGLDGNQVSVTFTAAQPETRAAIENALPQLREMFADNGIALGNASVSAESSQQQSPRPDGSGATRFARDDLVEAQGAAPMRAAITRLVDTFA